MTASNEKFHTFSLSLSLSLSLSQCAAIYPLAWAYIIHYLFRLHLTQPRNHLLVRGVESPGHDGVAGACYADCSHGAILVASRFFILQLQVQGKQGCQKAFAMM
jgi:hypothetical protein